MSDTQLIIISLASVTVLLIWLVIGVLEKIRKQAQDQDLKFTNEVEQDNSFFP